MRGRLSRSRVFVKSAYPDSFDTLNNHTIREKHRVNGVTAPQVRIHFSDYFAIPPSAVDSYGAVNVSLVADLPIFIDPFLLFNSKKQEYRKLHDSIVKYLVFLRRKSEAGPVTRGLLMAWYTFKEVHQTWLGFSKGEIAARDSG